MRKLIYNILTLLIVVIIFLMLWSNRVDNNSIVPVLDNFYSDFIDKDYSNMYNSTDFSKYTQNPNMTNEGKVSLAQGLLNNDRHFYGEIKGHLIKSMNWRGIHNKSATVAVITMDGYGSKQIFYDEVIVMKKGENWFITEYYSGSPWRTMKMP